MSATVANNTEFQDGGKPVASPVYHVDQNGIPINGCSYAVIAAGATGPTVIKGSAGVLFGVLLSTSAAGAPLGYDNATVASGNVIAAIAGTAPIGLALTYPQGVKFSNGLTFAGGATMPAMTIFYN